MVCPMENGYPIWVVHGVPHGKWLLYMGGPWYAPWKMVTQYGWSIVHPIEKLTLWVHCGVPIEKVTFRVVHEVPQREGHSLGGP